jgi:hypothetical protein
MKRFTKIAVVFFLTLINLSIQLPALSDDSIATLPILPEHMFARKGVLDPCPHIESSMPKRYMIFWNDFPAIDGGFVLVIHPKQVFLRSTHDNPNYDKIYWLSALSVLQYDALIVFLDQYNGKVFSDKEVWNWGGYKVLQLANANQSPYATGDDWDAWYSKVNRVIKENMSRILSELNHGLPVSVKNLNLTYSISIEHGVPIVDDRVPNHANAADTKSRAAD